MSHVAPRISPVNTTISDEVLHIGITHRNQMQGNNRGKKLSQPEINGATHMLPMLAQSKHGILMLKYPIKQLTLKMVLTFPLLGVNSAPIELCHTSTGCAQIPTATHDMVVTTISLADVTLLCHQSQHEDDQNRDPDIEEVLKCPVCLLASGVPFTSAAGYNKAEDIEGGLQTLPASHHIWRVTNDNSAVLFETVTTVQYGDA
ncbi:hypothetical protein DEU56DRAFT_759715 [Suillus clintonianus]|uniref:uncharacterized protein n=1 Tax=Suillus clintonianus TaxID=1904413 RepID=UPI001B86AB98|nr:uncharacterized protein DEU56DRAFT_759715 [Suillus clintonianus]KAG2124358.1 hypothetical protein DEU56DRAFT_759715 [Suillus clintonianus]